MKTLKQTIIIIFIASTSAWPQQFPLALETNRVATNTPATPRLLTDEEVGIVSIEETRTKAEKGDSAAQFQMGLDYFNGNGVTKDETEAVKWYRKAADQNDPEAQWYLGGCYFNGVGVSKDEARAVEWWRKAALQNVPQAQSNLGVCYDNGFGVASDEHEAVKWYRKAADQNNAQAQLNVGFAYANGRGVAKDEAEAVNWFRKAAAENNSIAQYNLGVCYYNGDGVMKDYVEAVSWYRKAADQNLARAQYNLGVCCVSGNGVVKDQVEGYKWLLLAAGQGDESAKLLMTILEYAMTQEQIAEGQKLARNFKPRKMPSVAADNSSVDIAQTRPEASGTGFFITEDGYLISNFHVIKDATQIRLVTSAGLIVAKVVKVDAANDVALLKADGKFAPLPVASSRTVRLGNTVATVGFPNIGLQGFAPKLAKGEIASLSGAQDDPRYFQISVPLQPGNSGGALVDDHGNVVGIVSAKLDAAVALEASGAFPENVNYAVKSSFLLSFLESVPETSAKLKEPVSTDRKFDDVVQSAQQAAVLVLVY